MPDNALEIFSSWWFVRLGAGLLLGCFAGWVSAKVLPKPLAIVLVVALIIALLALKMVTDWDLEALTKTLGLRAFLYSCLLMTAWYLEPRKKPSWEHWDA